MNLNFTNVEDLIFYNNEVQKLLPSHMFSIFEQWRLSKRVFYLAELGKHAILDFLNALTVDDIQVLEVFFGEPVFVEKLNYDISNSITVPIEENYSFNSNFCDKLCQISSFNYYTLSRNKDQIHITFWR